MSADGRVLARIELTAALTSTWPEPALLLSFAVEMCWFFDVFLKDADICDA
jgi:hypothetical protein